MRTSLGVLCLCREENTLVEQFVFEVLVVFIESLALAHADDRSIGNVSFTWCIYSPATKGAKSYMKRWIMCTVVPGAPSTGTLQQCGTAIDHLKRIFQYKAAALNQHNAKRRLPRWVPNTHSSLWVPNGSSSSRNSSSKPGHHSMLVLEVVTTFILTFNHLTFNHFLFYFVFYYHVLSLKPFFRSSILKWWTTGSKNVNVSSQRDLSTAHLLP